MKVTRTGPKLTDIDLSPPALMREIGEGLIARVRTRTTKGTDADGKGFAALSPSYAKQKRKALGHARADLTVSGRMLNDITVRPRPGAVTLSFISGGSASSGGTFIQRSRSVGAAEKAFFHNVSGAGKKRVVRPFFGLSSQDITWVMRKIEIHATRELR